MNPDVLRGFFVWLVLSAAFYFVFPFFLVSDPFIRLFVSLNLGTCGVVLMDKLFAKWRVRRVPEIVFYTSSFFGGSIGMLIGMYAFRHKTRKGSFQFVLGLLILIQIFLVWFFWIA